jgi:hypothetical protein
MTAKVQKGARRLLIFDGYDSYCTQEFLEVLEAGKTNSF